MFLIFGNWMRFSPVFSISFIHENTTFVLCWYLCVCFYYIFLFNVSKYFYFLFYETSVHQSKLYLSSNYCEWRLFGDPKPVNHCKYKSFGHLFFFFFSAKNNKQKWKFRYIFPWFWENKIHSFIWLWLNNLSSSFSVCGPPSNQNVSTCPLPCK